jgi:PAS domain S-box-containing protein
MRVTPGHSDLMKKILVIDDDKPFRLAVMATLRRQGYEMLEAASGSEGFSVALAGRPSLILSDVNMAGGNGFELLKELRVYPETSAIPVIIMTGETHKADARFSMAQGADDYLAKPFEMESMLSAVAARLQRREGINRAVASENLQERISLAEKMRLLNSALEAAANGIAVTKVNGEILWVNQAFTQLTGYTAAEAIGQNPRILRSRHHHREFYTEMWAAINTGKVWHGELVNRRKDGSYYDEEMTITPVRDASGAIQNFIAIKQDVSGRKQTERLLAHERDLLQALMDNLPDHIYFKDANSRFTRINRAHARHLGLQKPAEAIGKSDADFFSVREARQKQVDERRVLATGAPMLGLVEKSETAGESKWVSSTKVPLLGENGKIIGLVGISRDITKRKRAEEELQWKTAFLEAQVNSSIDGVLVTDEHRMRILQNQRMTDLFKIPQHLVDDHTAPGVAAQRQWIAAMTTNPGQFLEKTNYLDSQPNEISHDELDLKDGKVLDLYSSPVLDKEGRNYGRIWTVRDMTERKRAEQERQMMELQMRQTQKLESIGQLAAGIAHEINTPTQYVGDNTRFVKESFADILKVLRSHQELLVAAKTNAITPELLARHEEILAAGDVEYLCKQIPAALAETLEGVERVSKIVRAMKEFSHPGGKEKTSADLNKAIQSTVTVANNEWKYVASMILELEPELPLVPCFIGEFNQCILNLIINAAHAIADVVGPNPQTKGCITVRTRRDGEFVEVRVSDTGTGIAEAARPKIFEPFFTTKDVGKGTGQGLSIVYACIVKRHGGTVTFETEFGHGTMFVIRLPLKATVTPAAKAAMQKEPRAV